MKQTKQWKLYRDEPEIELTGEFDTKNEAVCAANGSSDEMEIFSYNQYHQVWSSNTFTITRNGHPTLREVSN